MKRERLAVPSRTRRSGLRGVLRTLWLVVAGLFLTWLELTVGWLSYALDSSRNRWLTKAWLLGVMTLVAGAFAVTDRRELVVPVLGVAGIFLVYLFVVDGVIALVERRGRRDRRTR